MLVGFQYICDKTRTRTEWVGGWVVGWCGGGGGGGRGAKAKVHSTFWVVGGLGGVGWVVVVVVVRGRRQRCIVPSGW